MTQKRRVIYMTDQEWAFVTQRAKDHGVTISAEIRGNLVGDWRERPVAGPSLDRSAQQERDAILNRVNRKKTEEAQ